MLETVGPAAASFSLSLASIVALRPVAIAIDLVDRPGGRKIHAGNIPVIGGLAMFLGMALGLVLLPINPLTVLAFLIACSMLVAVGLIDDRYDLSPWTRLSVQVVAVCILMLGAGLSVRTLGNPVGIGDIDFSGLTSYCFTVLIALAAINAFNMLDGMDGLAGGIALVALGSLAYLAAGGGLAVTTAACVVFIGAIVGFMVFNFPTRFNRRFRCFMGDAGSTLLGFIVAAFCIRVSQNVDAPAAPVTMLWIVAVPLFELLWTTARRVVRGSSPFRGDRDHFHHRLLNAGFGPRGAFALLVALAVLLAVIGISLEEAGVSDALSLALLALAGIGVVLAMRFATSLARAIPMGWRRYPPLDPPQSIAANEEPAPERLAA